MVLEPPDDIQDWETYVCGYCGKDYDYDRWMKDEHCSHCGKFLDNPPQIMTKEEFKDKKTG